MTTSTSTEDVNLDGKPMTQEEVAMVLGITRSQVDLIERRAMRKLRNYLKRIKKIKKQDLL